MPLVPPKILRLFAAGLAVPESAVYCVAVPAELTARSIVPAPVVIVRDPSPDVRKPARICGATVDPISN